MLTYFTSASIWAHNSWQVIPFVFNIPNLRTQQQLIINYIGATQIISGLRVQMMLISQLNSHLIECLYLLFCIRCYFEVLKLVVFVF